MRLPFAAALVAFALAEAFVTTSAALRADLSLANCSWAALGTSAIVLAFATPPLFCLDALLRSEGAKRLGQGLHEGMSAGASVALATWLSCAAIGASTLLVLWASPWWMSSMSQRFGTAFGLIALALTMSCALLVAAALGNALGRNLSLHTDLARKLDRAFSSIGPGLGLALLLAYFVEPRYATAPLVACVALGLALAFNSQKRVLWPVLVGFAASAGTIALLERLPPAATEVLTYRPPYASLMFGLGQRAFDRDGDGSASILLGFDCDDHDPRVHPGARDIPGNQIDENCSGRDAPLYVPPKPKPTEHKVTQPHDIVIILLDAMRPDRLSIAGYGRKTSPVLDAFARQGTWFRNAYTTAPSTRFAVASLFTGRDVRRLRYTNLGGNRFRLEPGAPTLAKRLSQAGYRSLGYPITYAYQHNRGTGQGFSEWNTAWPDAQWKTVGKKKSEITTQKVLDQLAATPSNQRLFLFAHYDCTHTPYYKFEGFDFGNTPSDLYDSGIAHCDAQLGRIFAALKARPTWERTAVFIVSDHGELFGEHGLTAHGNSLFENDVRVVMVARVPGGKAQIIDTPVQLHWIAPTVLELAGLQPESEMDAVSLLDTIVGTGQPAQRPLFMFTELHRGSAFFQASAVLEWPYKLIRNHRSRTVDLFNVLKDPGEQRSLRDAAPERVGRLSDLLEGYEAWAKP